MPLEDRDEYESGYGHCQFGYELTFDYAQFNLVNSAFKLEQ